MGALAWRDFPVTDSVRLMSDQAQTPTDCEECGQPLKFALADEQPPIDLNSADVTIDVKGYCTNPECSRFEESGC